MLDCFFWRGVDIFVFFDIGIFKGGLLGEFFFFVLVFVFFVDFVVFIGMGVLLFVII